MILVYDETEKRQVGMFECPHCGTIWQGKAMHKDDCSLKNSDKPFEGVLYRIGPNQVQKVINRAEISGNDDSEWYGVSLNKIREQIPEALKQIN